MDRILVVDDDVLILSALSRILQSEGYKVVTHSDPVLAAREQGFDVVLTDFMMPYLNGIELLSALREKNPRAVRLMLTAAADFKVASEAVNRGEVFRLLGKPWAMSELMSSVRQAFEHRRLVEANERLTREVADKNEELLEVNQDLERRVIERTAGLLDGLISALDYRDTETQWHSRRVSLYARRLAQEIGLTGPALDVVEQGALLHDIGKIGVRDSILLKPGPLTPDEWVEMKQHPEFGYRMLAKMPYLHEAALIVLQHQERWDGKGYPLGLKGEEIVVGARIFCLVDTLDAITSDRPYRKGRPMSVARDEIRRCAGTQFDPALADAFLRLPETEWARIRREVEVMEEAESRRWNGGKLNAQGEAEPARASGA
ncbi:HD domain-containing phosphohydrolase [Corallococcus llansteffanensis]|uniref:HD domain-containing protein n=1 Tax=Corallococcus llansteffanensis TaxID=2316731 RepID=A0A3A8PAB1_9BACT|nr:HD domain-containing phosphohydrolase [Corallococcus llansteffanensis]RKH52849.1 HD domain-containing protein [Corallococcus llansteffanensis]